MKNRHHDLGEAPGRSNEAGRHRVTQPGVATRDACPRKRSRPQHPAWSDNDSDGSAGRFVLMLVGIMRARIGYNGHLFGPSPLQVALLLAVLILHLGFMASPLHRLMLADDTMAAGMSSTAPLSTTALQLERADHGEHVGHCLIPWVNDAQRLSVAGLLAVVLAVATLELERHMPGMRPVARALGPPATGDAQAVLQVFRL